MKALTVCQPYAWLITLPPTDPRHKRVENRSWPTHYRGPLAIHAGRSRKWLGTYDELTLAEEMALRFGAVVAVANLHNCVRVEGGGIVEWARPVPASSLRWVVEHAHTEGPWCSWVLTDVRVLARPIAAAGRQGLWDWQPPADARLRPTSDCRAPDYGLETSE